MFLLGSGACASAGRSAPAAVGAAGPAVGAALAPPTARARAWARHTLAGLSLRQKVAQLMVPWVGGGYLAVGTPEYRQLQHWISDDGVGGLVVSIGPPMEMAAKLNTLQRLARVPLLVATDMEHGPGQRLNGAVVYPYGLEVGGGTEFPPVMGVGATGDPRLAYAMGRITAIEARAVGIHMDFAPDADVNNNPNNPIINVRSYGADPRAVARMVVAHIHGLQDNGMWATAKHFPGHGDTGVDSHLQLPIITADSARVDSVELVPFRSAVAAGVHAVMSAHIAFPALTGDTTPASLSPRLMAVLRRRLGFRGLIVTDALDMGAIVNRYGNDRVPVLALKAGADVLLMPPDVDTAIASVLGAVRRGELSERRIDASVLKILEAKAAWGLDRRRTVDLSKVPETVGIPSHLAVADTVAERAITVGVDQAHLLPLTRERRVLSIVYSDDDDPLAGRVLQRELGAHFRELHAVRIDRRTTTAELDSLSNAADSADAVIISPFVRVLARKGGVALPPGIAAFIDALARRRPTVVVSFGNPYLLSEFPDVSTYMLAWGQAAVVQRAAARALTGQAPVTGHLPIPIPPLLPLGAGVQIPALAAATAGAGGG